MLAITGATGQRGQHVLDALLATVSPNTIVALARDPAKAQDRAALGMDVRPFDYAKPETLAPALAGVERLLLISSSEVGQRTAQHGAVIAAAKAAGVTSITYTSILHADTNPLILAEEHRATEALLQASGLAYAVVRHGWYTENFTGSVAPAIAHGAVLADSSAHSADGVLFDASHTLGGLLGRPTTPWRETLGQAVAGRQAVAG
jgi:NAD(P)H dehydrogenase (quinone)